MLERVKIMDNITDKNKEISLACEHLKTLLEEQYDRVKRLSECENSDFTKDKIIIGLIDGDGIGPVIMDSARRVLKELLKDEAGSGKVVLKDIKGLTIENRLALKSSVPDDVLNEIKTCTVILKGPTTTPKGGSMESANVVLRRELDLFANVRPVKVLEKGIDWIFFRENTEGEYVLGSKGLNLFDDEKMLAVDFKVTTVIGTGRIARAAFEYAKNNNKSYVALVTKANIMKKTDGLFSKIVNEVAEDYKGIELEEWYVDICAANLLNEGIRKKFQVFILPNLYGDIITDEAAEIQGGVGTAGSANIGARYAMFEAVHGSAPRMVEAGLSEHANPSSILSATVMLLNHIGFNKKADILERALDEVKKDDRFKVTGDGSGVKACQFTDELIKRMSII